MSLISCTKPEDHKITLEVSVSAEDFKAAIEKAYKKNVRKIDIAGFRKGKAPRSIIEKKYGEDVFFDDALNEVIPESYSAAIDECEYEPVERADIDIVSVSKAEGVVYKAVVTVKPEMEINNYMGLEIEVDENNNLERDVDDRIKEMATEIARIVDVTDRKTQNTDEITFDYEGFIDGVPFAGGKAENATLTLGSNQFIIGFEKQCEKREIGEEFEVYVTFPQNYHNSEVAGKPAVFKCKLHAIKGKILPEIDDEFARDVSDFDTLEELREDTRQKCITAFENLQKTRIENQISEKLVELVEGDIPQVMFDNVINELRSDFEQSVARYGINLEQYMAFYRQSSGEEPDFDKRFAEQANGRVRLRLALETIARKENITVNEEDYEEEIARLAEMYQCSVDVMRKMMANADLTNDIKVNKAVKLVTENIKKIPTKTSENNDLGSVAVEG